MTIIYDKVDTGKTKRLIEESSRTGARIIAVDAFRAKRIKDKAEAYSIPIEDPISWGQVVKGHQPIGARYLVDDLDQVLEMVLGGVVEGFTMTKED